MLMKQCIQVTKYTFIKGNKVNFKNSFNGGILLFFHVVQWKINAVWQSKCSQIIIALTHIYQAVTTQGVVLAGTNHAI